MERNPFKQPQQDPNRLVSNVNPVAISPGQYGTDTNFATSLAKVGGLLSNIASYGTQLAYNKTKQYSEALKQQGEGIALKQQDILKSGEIEKYQTALSTLNYEIDKANKPFHIDDPLPNSNYSPTIDKGSALSYMNASTRGMGVTDSIKDNSFGSQLKRTTEHDIATDLVRQDSQQKLDSLKQQQQKIQGSLSTLQNIVGFVPRGTEAIQSYFEAKAPQQILNINNYATNLINNNPNMSPTEFRQEMYKVYSAQTKDMLNLGATDAVKQINSAVDNVVAEKEVLLLKNQQAVMQQVTQIDATNNILRAITTTTVPNTSLQVPTLGTATVIGKDGQVRPAIQQFNGSTITSEYGEQRGGRKHPGIDVVLKGDNIQSVLNGTVSDVGFDPNGYGHYVKVKQGDGSSILYAHLAKPPSLKKGSKIKAGDTIGIQGATGNASGKHLHLETFDSKGNRVNPVAMVQMWGNQSPQSAKIVGVATGVTNPSNAVTATPPEIQKLRNTTIVQELNNVMGVFGGAEGLKKSQGVIDSMMKSLIDNGIPHNRAYDILNQLIKTATDNVSTATTDTDKIKNVLTASALTQFKGEKGLTYLANLSVAKSNQDKALMEAQAEKDYTTQNKMVMSIWSSVKNGEDIIPAISLAEQQFGSKLTADSWKLLTAQISQYNTKTSRELQEQKYVSSQERQSREEAIKLAGISNKGVLAQLKAIDTLRDVNAVTGGNHGYNEAMDIKFKAITYVQEQTAQGNKVTFEQALKAVAPKPNTTPPSKQGQPTGKTQLGDRKQSTKPKTGIARLATQ